MARYKLDIDYDYDFLLIGICCHEKDYRFVWSLNNALATDFKKGEDILIREKGAASPSAFTVFEYTDEEMHADYHLITNRCGNSFLVPEHKKADYLMMKKGEQMEEEAAAIMTRLRTINNVILVYEINASELRSKQHLIF